MASRVDFYGNVSTYTPTPQGGIKAPAYLTRIGVFTYTQPDGSQIKELRHPDEVFEKDSLESLAGAPVTVDHPSQGVHADSWRHLAVGHVGDNVRADGRYVAAHVRVQDSVAVQGVVNKQLVEFSCGYDCDLDPTPGTYDGEAYDLVQRNIRYNHVGMGPVGWGRAGSEVRLRMDSASVAYMPVQEAAPEVVPTSDYPTDMADQSTNEVTLQAKADALAAQLATANERIASLESQITSTKADAANRFDAAVSARVALIDSARAFGVSDVAGMTERDILIKCISTTDGEFNAEGRSDDYLRARFDFASTSANASKVALASLQVATTDSAAQPAPVSSIETARLANLKRSQEAWKVSK